MNEFLPGQAIIESVILISADGKKTQDITQYTTVIELFESVTLPCITGALTIVDTAGLAKEFPIHGVELIKLTYKPIIPGATTTYIELRVHEQKATTVSNNSKLQAYVLKCVDLDFFNSVKLYVEKAYKSQHSEMVVDIVTRIMGVSSSSLFVEPTKGKQDLIVPGLNPYRAIDFVRLKSTSTQYEYAPYFFFRTINQGFIFSTLANLYQKGFNKPVRRFTRFDTFVSNKFEVVLPESEYNSIYNISFPRKFNNNEKVKRGAFSSRTNSFDIVTKQYLPPNDFKLAQSKIKGSIKGGYNAFVNDQQTPSVHHFIVVDTTKLPTHEASTLGPKMSYMSLLSDDFITIDVHGDNRLSCGDIIEVEVPIINSTLDDSSAVDYETLSGTYIITKVKHVMLKEMRTHFKTTLQLVRNSSLYAQ